MLLRVRRSPIHNHDLATIRGVYGVRPDLPAIGGSEFSGTVEEADAGSPLRKGARVACITQGAWAEFALSPAAGIVPIPDSIPDEAACQLLAMPLSAIVLLDELHVKAGDWIVQNAASGAVGRTLMQEAQRRGINVINLVRREEAERDLRSAGAQHVVVTGGDWPARVREIGKGAPIVRAIDSISGSEAIAMQRLLGVDGELIVFGGLGAEPMRLDPSLMISREIVVRGFWMNAWMRRPGNADRAASAIRRVFELAMTGELPLPVAGVYPPTRARDALVAAETPGRGGKVLFAMNP